MVDAHTRRACPFCGAALVLGYLPIVATKVRQSQEDARDKRWYPVHQANVLRHAGQWPVIRDAPLGDPPDGLMAQALTITSRSFGTTRLPALEDLADSAYEPARVCVTCVTPLPENLDDRPVYTVAVLGASGVGKTHFLASMLRAAVYSQGLEDIGWSEFTFDEATGARFDRDYYVPVYREHRRLGGTDPDPKTVVTRALGCKITYRDAAPALLLLHDIAGEMLTDRRMRERTARFLRHSSAVIFLVDPVMLDLPGDNPGDGPDRSWINQTNLLNDCLAAMSTQHRNRTPVAITLSKGDLIARHFNGTFATQPDTSSWNAWKADIQTVDYETQYLLRNLNARDLHAAGRRIHPDLVSFHTVAPIGSQPDDEKITELRPVRCLDPLATVLFRIPGLTAQPR